MSNDPIQMAIEAINSTLRVNAVGLHLTGENVEGLRRSVAALRQHQQDGGWLPIETAPRDGTKVLLSQGNPNKNSPRHCFIGGFSDQYQLWIMDGGACTNGNHFIRWKPIPPAPKKENDDE